MLLKVVLLLGLLTLTGCAGLIAPAIDALLPEEEGINIDAQIGSNENKVKTGIGSLGLDKETNLTIEDSQHIDVKNSDNRYKITTTGETKINVYETNYWLYGIFAVYLLGKPLLRALQKRRERHNLYKHIDSLTTPSGTSVDGDDSEPRRNS